MRSEHTSSPWERRLPSHVLGLLPAAKTLVMVPVATAPRACGSGVLVSNLPHIFVAKNYTSKEIAIGTCKLTF